MRDGVLAAIGGTPTVRLQHLVEPGMADVWVKLEAANPTGSYKDRMALAMIEAAERDGRLQPGQTVVEYTGGSTGSSLALVCALTGHPLHIVTSDAFSIEKRRTIAAFGADLLVISYGADTYAGDPISFFRLETADYAIMAGRIAALGLPSLVVMEGGYAVDALGANVASFLEGFR